MITKIDHLVYAVPNLEDGMMEIEALFGVEPVYGGKHQTKGTHNALLSLGHGCYFEIIAVDPGNTSVPSPRWMGVDTGLQAGKLTRWAMTSNQIEEDAAFLKEMNTGFGKLESGSREKSDGSVLKWQLSTPLATPQVEITPFLIDWSGSDHPTNSLVDQCLLHSLRAQHPHPQLFASMQENLGLSMEIALGETVELIARIETPRGIIELK